MRVHPALPERAATILERYWTILDPPTDEWPVFPSGHVPPKYRAVRKQLADTGVPDSEIEAIPDSNQIDTILRERDVVPPALSTNGARSRRRPRGDRPRRQHGLSVGVQFVTGPYEDAHVLRVARTFERVNDRDASAARSLFYRRRQPSVGVERQPPSFTDFDAVVPI